MTLRAPELLTAQHALGNFNSGQSSLDERLKLRAPKNQASGASRTFVACDQACVVAYYALTSAPSMSMQPRADFAATCPTPYP